MYTAQEKDAVLQHLEKSRNNLLSSITGLSDAQSNFKASTDVWSIADVVEHLAILEDLVAMRLEQLGTVADSGQPKFNQPDAVLMEKVKDRSVKFQTPERGQPTGKPLKESLDRLDSRRKQIVAFLHGAPADFRRHTMPHPVLGPLDGHQWLLALAGHCARHVEQINETKMAANFPH